MSSRVATLKLGAILASTVVSSYAVFGHDAWAPEPAQLGETGLFGSNGASAAGYYINTFEPATVLKWPGSWTTGSPALLAMTGKPCSTYNLPAGTIADQVIERHGNYAKCIKWPNEGARLTEDLSPETGRTARAKTLSKPEPDQPNETVVQFPATWTYDITLAADTYCASWPAPAGTAVGTIIVRTGNYAKCSY